MKFKITDDSGLMGIVDTHSYKSFIGEDWDFSRLSSHIKSEMSKNSILFWATGREGVWNVEAKENLSNARGFREILGSIRVTENELYLVNYEGLSEAAQFKDMVLPERDMENFKIPLKSGIYTIRIVQLADPNKNTKNNDIDFLIEYEQVGKAEYKWEEIPWMK